MLEEYLGLEGFDIQLIHNGKEGVKVALSNHFDLILLDVMLPELNGFEVLQKLREKIKTPVLMLTARGDDVDRIVGLEMGADDYLPKPFNPRELVARLRAILRRMQQIESGLNFPATLDTIQVGELIVNPASRYVTLANETLYLTSTEYNLLELLVRSAGHLVTKECLSEQGLNRKLMSYDRSIDMHMSNLRRKLKEGNNAQARITTVRGLGYQLSGA